jgi:hypothetical protein
MSGLSGALADLCDWLSGVLGEATPVRASAPAPSADGPGAGIDVWPLELLADGASPDGPVRLRVRHVIVPAGALPDALAVLDRVIAAVAAGDRYRPVFEPLPAHLWTATGIVPRPALVLDVPVQIARAVPAIPRVRGELAVHVVPVRAIRGRVVGPGAVPLPGITVTAGGRSARTDPHGEFTLPGLPGDRAVPLHLSGRGRHLRADVAAHTAEPVVIHCDFEED